MSVYYSILQAVQSSLDDIPGIPTTDIRFDLQLFEGETLPLVIIASGPDYETKPKQTFAKGVWWDYPVLVALYTAGNRLVKKDLQAYYDLRESIRNTLFQPVLGSVETQFDVDVNPLEVSKLAAVAQSNYRITGWKVTYRSAEQRIS